jgi:hypothetical protein
MAWYRVVVQYKKRTNWGIVALEKFDFETVVVEHPDGARLDLHNHSSPFMSQVSARLWKWNAKRPFSTPAADAWFKVHEVKGPFSNREAAAGASASIAVKRSEPVASPSPPAVEFERLVIDAADLRRLDTVLKWIGEPTPSMSMTRLPVVVAEVKTHEAKMSLGEATIFFPSNRSFKWSFQYSFADTKFEVERPLTNEAASADEWERAVLRNRFQPTKR